MGWCGVRARQFYKDDAGDTRLSDGGGEGTDERLFSIYYFDLALLDPSSNSKSDGHLIARGAASMVLAIQLLIPGAIQPLFGEFASNLEHPS